MNRCELEWPEIGMCIKKNEYVNSKEEEDKWNFRKELKQTFEKSLFSKLCSTKNFLYVSVCVFLVTIQYPIYI